MSPEQSSQDGRESQEKLGGFYRGLRKILNRDGSKSPAESDPAAIAENLRKDGDYWIEPQEHDAPLSPELYAAIQDPVVDLLQHHPDTQPDSNENPTTNTLTLAGLNAGEATIIETTLAARADDYYWIAQISGGNERRGYHDYVLRADGTIDEQFQRGEADSSERSVQNILLSDEQAQDVANWLKEIQTEVADNLLPPGENNYKRN